MIGKHGGLPRLNSRGPIEAGDPVTRWEGKGRLPRLNSRGPIEAFWRLPPKLPPVGVFHDSTVVAPLKRAGEE